MREFPKPYDHREKEGMPYYPVLSTESLDLYNQYKLFTDRFSNFYLLGRLAEYRYYDMDDAVEAALNLSDRLFQFHIAAHKPVSKRNNGQPQSG